MIPPHNIARVRLEDLIEQILLSQTVTQADRYQVMLALLADAVSHTELILINRLLYGVRKGLLKLAD